MDMPPVDVNTMFQSGYGAATHVIQQQKPVATYDEGMEGLSPSEQKGLIRMLSGGTGGLPEL